MAITEREQQRLARKEDRRKKQIPVARSYSLRIKGDKSEKVPVEVHWTQNSVAFTTTLPTSGEQVTATFKFGTDTVERQVRMMHSGDAYVASIPSGFRPFGRAWKNRLARDKTGKPITIKIAVQATFLTLTAGGGFKMTSKSICKEPDPWDRQEGIKFALRHLFNGGEDSDKRDENKDKLTKILKDEKDYQALLKVCCTKPLKMSQIRRLQRREAGPTPAKGTDPETHSVPVKRAATR